MLRLILTCYNSSEHGDPPYALITITNDFIAYCRHKLALSRAKRRRDPDYHSTAYWDGAADYIDKDINDFEEMYGFQWLCELQDRDRALEPEAIVPPCYHLTRTDENLIRVTPDRLWWEADSHYDSTRICTTSINLADLKELEAHLHGKHLKKITKHKAGKRKYA